MQRTEISVEIFKEVLEVQRTEILMQILAYVGNFLYLVGKSLHLSDAKAWSPTSRHTSKYFLNHVTFIVRSAGQRPSLGVL